MHEILPGLWLGNLEDARQHSAAMDAVVNCTVDLPFFGMIDDVPTHPNFIPRQPDLMRIPVNDDVSANASLGPYLPAAVDHIRSRLAQGKRVLVHCFAGMQRSAAVAAAVVMQERGLNAYVAVEFVRDRRPEAFLGGVNFMPSLHAFVP